MRRIVVTALVAVLPVGACSDDDDGDADAADVTTTSETTEASAPTTVSRSPSSTALRTTSTAATTLRCNTVAFTPNSEDAASEVTATGLPCREAEAFVRVAGQRTSSGGPAELDVEGYRCVRTGVEEDPLPRSSFECVNGAKKVTFVRS